MPRGQSCITVGLYLRLLHNSAVELQKIRSVQSKLILFISSFVILATLIMSWIAFSYMAETIKKERIHDVGHIAYVRHQTLIFQLKAYQRAAGNLLSRLHYFCRMHEKPYAFDRDCIRGRLKLHFEIENARSVIFRSEKLHINLSVGNSSNPNISKLDFAKDQLAVFKKRGAHNQAQPFFVMAEDKTLDLQVFVEYPLDSIQKIFSVNEELGNSGESFLANHEGFFITEARYHAHQGMNEIISANPMQSCLQKNNNEVLDLDYRMAPIIHGFRYIPEIGGGCIMAHIEQAEAFAGLKEMEIQFLSVAVGFIIFSIGLIVIFAKTISGPIVYLAETAIAIAKGNYSLRSGIKRDDEIGLLSVSFNRMTENLLDAKREIEKASTLNAGIVNASSDTIISINLNGIVESCNRAAEEQVGYRVEELLGQHINLIMPKLVWPPQRSLMRSSLVGEAEEMLILGGELPIKRKDGSIFDTFFRITEVSINDEHKYIAIIRDLSEIRKIEAALQESENKYRQAFASVKEYAIIMLDQDGIINGWNVGQQFRMKLSDHAVLNFQTIENNFFATSD